MTFAERKAAQLRAWPFPQLSETPAGRLEQVMAWLHNTDEDGNPDPLITPELAARLLCDEAGERYSTP